MAKQPLGCGVEEHDVECLCDIPYSDEPFVVNVTIPDDYFAGQEICDMFNLGVPWTGADLATFFEKVAEVRSYINRNGVVNRIPDAGMKTRWRGNTKMTAEQLEEFKGWIRDGGKPTELVNRLMEVHGIKIHKSYVVKTRIRMRERNEL